MGGKAGLVMVLGFSFILGYVSLNVNQSAERAIENMSEYNQVQTSHNLALSGAYLALANLYQDTTWRAGVSQDLNSDNLQGSFSANVVNVAGDTLMLRSVSSYVVGVGKRVRDTVEVYLDPRRSRSYSEYAWLTNKEGMAWITGDVVWGKMHTNDVVKINGSPLFVGKLTTAKNFIVKPGRGINQARFQNGYETGVDSIPLPNDLSELIAQSDPAQNGRRFNDEIWVDLSPGTSTSGDGFALVRLSEMGPVVDSISLGTGSPFNGVLLSNKKVNIRGVLDGRLSVVSMSNVIVQGNITCEQNPRSGQSDDMLGLIADTSVVVADNLATSGDLSIDASILTRVGSFTAQNYNSKGVNGDLHVYGSIVQNIRGAVGTFNTGSGIRTNGYAKDYKFDDRLKASTPPHYPSFRLRTYAIAGWWESYSWAKAEEEQITPEKKRDD